MIIKLITPVSPEYEEMLDLRDNVLRKPLGMKLDRNALSDESKEYLIVCIEKEKIQGCVILTPVSGNVLKLRQMAVSEEVQGKGYGSAIVKWAEQLAIDKGYTTIEMNARKYAIPFYEKAGYHTYGEEFTEVGIPHLKMRKKIINS